MAPALNSRLRRWRSDVDDAIAHARERLGLAITALRQRGVIARGAIGDADPLLAIEDALAGFPSGRHRDRDRARGPLELDRARLVEKATTRFGIAAVHLVWSSTWSRWQSAANRPEPLHDVGARVRSVERRTQTE